MGFKTLRVIAYLKFVFFLCLTLYDFERYSIACNIQNEIISNLNYSIVWSSYWNSIREFSREGNCQTVSKLLLHKITYAQKTELLAKHSMALWSKNMKAKL